VPSSISAVEPLTLLLYTGQTLSSALFWKLLFLINLGFLRQAAAWTSSDWGSYWSLRGPGCFLACLPRPCCLNNVSSALRSATVGGAADLRAASCL